LAFKSLWRSGLKAKGNRLLLASAAAGLPWVNVGTPDKEQFRAYRCFPINHPAHDGSLPPDEDAPGMSEYGPYDARENREKQMTQNVRTRMAAYKSGVLILGVAHLHSMFSKLRALGFSVIAYCWL
jgi:hypothetical protein